MFTADRTTAEMLATAIIFPTELGDAVIRQVAKRMEQDQAYADRILSELRSFHH